MISRMLSTPVLEAASISITSIWRDSRMASQWGVEFRHVDGGRIGIIEGPGDQAGRRGLADAAHAGQHIGLGDAARGEGIGEGAHHRFLADQVGEILWAGICGRERDILERSCVVVASVMTGSEHVRGGRLDGQPVPISLGLLPSGPDPVGERHVRRQPPGRYIGVLGRKGKGGICPLPLAVTGCQ